MNFFVTKPHDCSYLADQEASTLFLDPDIEVDVPLYHQLNEHGFRRSGEHFYRPHCANCKGCISTRLAVEYFDFNRRFRKIARKNTDLQAVIATNEYTDEHFELYQRYINERHKDGDMYPANQKQYADFLCREQDFSFRIELRERDSKKLVSVAVVDQLLDGLSAIYTFFDPHQDKRSLGVQSVLTQINLAKRMGLPYLYLGYYVPNCRKMDYKQHYQPLEYLVDEIWQKEPPSNEWVFSPREDKF